MLCLIYISKLSLSGLKTSIENNTKRLIEFLKINHSYSMYGIKNTALDVQELLPWKLELCSCYCYGMEKIMMDQTKV